MNQPTNLAFTCLQGLIKMSNYVTNRRGKPVKYRVKPRDGRSKPIKIRYRLKSRNKLPLQPQNENEAPANALQLGLQATNHHRYHLFSTVSVLNDIAIPNAQQHADIVKAENGVVDVDLKSDGEICPDRSYHSNSVMNFFSSEGIRSDVDSVDFMRTEDDW